MRWTRRIAITGIAWCAGVLGASALPGGPHLATPIIIVPTLLLALPVFVVTVLVVTRVVGRGTHGGQAVWRLLRETMPGWLLIASWLLFAGFWLI